MLRHSFQPLLLINSRKTPKAESRKCPHCSAVITRQLSQSLSNRSLKWWRAFLNKLPVGRGLWGPTRRGLGLALPLASALALARGASGTAADPAESIGPDLKAKETLKIRYELPITGCMSWAKTTSRVRKNTTKIFLESTSKVASWWQVANLGTSSCKWDGSGLNRSGMIWIYIICINLYLLVLYGFIWF